MTLLDTLLTKVTNTFSQLMYHEKLLDGISEKMVDHENRLCKLESSAELNMVKIKNFILEERIKLNTGVNNPEKLKQLENKV